MRRETELFFDNLVREDRSIMDLFVADYTFVNERLARHYGIPNVAGDRFRRVNYGRQAARAPGAWQRAGVDLARQSHLSGASRQVGDGSAAWHPSAAATARRAGPRRDGRRQRSGGC